MSIGGSSWVNEVSLAIGERGRKTTSGVVVLLLTGPSEPPPIELLGRIESTDRGNTDAMWGFAFVIFTPRVTGRCLDPEFRDQEIFSFNSSTVAIMAASRPSRGEDFIVATTCAPTPKYGAVPRLLGEFWDEEGDQYGEQLEIA